MNYLEIERFLKSHECAECAGELVYRHNPETGEDEIRCGADHSHRGVERLKGFKEQYRQGGAIPLVVKANIERMERRKGMANKEVALLDERRKQEITAHLKSFQANLALSEVHRAFELVKMGFNPYYHLTVYQGRVCPTIDGLHWWKDQKGGKVRIISEPITDPATREAYGIGENEIGVISKLYREGETELAFTGFQRASKDEKHPVIKGSFVEHQHPFRLAEKRAEAQVIRKYAPISGVEAYIPEEVIGTSPSEGEEAESPPALKETQEIIVSPPIEDVIDAITEAEAPPPKPTRNPSTVTTYNELCKACHEDFKMQPKEILEELGYSSQLSITESMEECYLKIWAVRKK